MRIRFIRISPLIALAMLALAPPDAPEAQKKSGVPGKPSNSATKPAESLRKPPLSGYERFQGVKVWSGTVSIDQVKICTSNKPQTNQREETHLEGTVRLSQFQRDEVKMFHAENDVPGSPELSWLGDSTYRARYEKHYKGQNSEILEKGEGTFQVVRAADPDDKPSLHIGKNGYYFMAGRSPVLTLEGVASANGRTSKTQPREWDLRTLLDDARYFKALSPLPDTGMVLSGTLTIPDNNIAGGIDCQTTTTISWNFVPGDREQIELVVEPEGSPIRGKRQPFDDWVPEGGPSHDMPGNDLYLTARLVTSGGSQPAIGARSVRFELVKVSNETGICMNAPPRAEATAEPDMKFLALMNPQFEPPEDGGRSLRTKSGEHTEATAILSSFDYGSYATLKVTATMADGRQIVGYLKGDRAQQEIRLPRRAANSLIADAWKKKYRLTTQDDRDDSDALPKADRALGGHDGDGLHLYEEYRGFLQLGNHFRTDPGRKDQFVSNTIGRQSLPNGGVLSDVRVNARAADGIRLFQALSRLAVHYRLKPDEVEKDVLVNFNGTSLKRLGPKYGILVTESQEAGPATGWGDPGKKKVVTMTSGFGQDWESWNRVKVGQGRIYSDEYAASLAHELFHTCNLPHHGDEDVAEVNWKPQKADAAGHPYVLELPLNRRTGQPKAGAKEKIVFIKREDGSYVDMAKTGPEINVYIGSEHGQHSGFEDCVMRYSCAFAYVRKSEPDVRYLTGNREHGGELAGIFLCESPVGTGVNATGRQPWPRYGAAAANRGNCRNRLCVNDSIVH